MVNNEFNFDVLSDNELEMIDGGAVPLIPIAVGFVKGFVYTAGAIMTTKKFITGDW